MKHILTNYDSIFEGKLIPVAEDGDVHFECSTCGQQPTREDRSDVGIPTQAYFTCNCFSGACSIAITTLDEMIQYATTMNLI